VRSQLFFFERRGFLGALAAARSFFTIGFGNNPFNQFLGWQID
jgi:hypothetical protein